MKILITGGTGFIGSRLALRCLDEGQSVRILGQENTAAEVENKQVLEKKGAEIILASVNDKEILHEAIRGIEIVYHLAAAQHEMNIPDQKFWEVNVDGTRNMLEASIKSGVKRFIHGSTIGVYGYLEGEISEESPRYPDNIYGVTKYEGEKLVLSYQDKLPIVVIRISETYGPGDRRLLKLYKAINKGTFFMIGKGNNLHHPIYIDDLVDGFLLAATTPKAIGEVFVLSGYEANTTREMVTSIAEHLGSKGSRFSIPLMPMLLLATIIEIILRPLGIQPPLHRRRMDFFKKSFTFSQNKSKDYLGFNPQVSFRDGALETAKWYTHMGYLNSNLGIKKEIMEMDVKKDLKTNEKNFSKLERELTAKIEPFDSYWQAPSDIEKGYKGFGQFYKHNYLKFMPNEKTADILVISCGPGYFVNMLYQAGYTQVFGIDSDPGKVKYALQKKLNCKVERAFNYLECNDKKFDVIYAGQELNHLTKLEMLEFLHLCYNNLNKGGTLIVYGLNGSNPITGAENLAHNFDHYNTFTEYSLNQILEYTGFRNIHVIPLNLYVFYKNPINYLLILLDKIYTLFFKFSFMLYGKSVKILTKKIAAVCIKG
jgi:nucleoside-diphosphate-sugar epimerase/SAM-dependent methyltransferase